MLSTQWKSAQRPGGRSKHFVHRSLPEENSMKNPTVADTVFLHDLRIKTIVGIWEWERRIRQTVSIDLEMGADIRNAARTDRIEDAMDYKQIAKRVQQFVEDSSYQLVETLAENIATVVLREFEVPWITVRVNKPGAIRGSRDVGVIIRRERKDVTG
jgi:dihydroneopterin aldolase